MVRMTFRQHGGNEEYWDARWANTSVDSTIVNVEKYPGKYAHEILERTEGAILEAGCGAGRNVIYGHDMGRQIIGIEYSRTAVEKIKAHRQDIDVRQANIMGMPFANATFAGVMAFGLYHNLQFDCDKALAETLRVMKSDGLLAASVRIDNIANRINDWIEARKYTASKDMSFHKANYTEHEFRNMLTAAGFSIERVDCMENMPLFYKFRLFRHADHKVFNERRGRTEGYRLSYLADKFQRLLSFLFPRSFCNVLVFIARRPKVS